MPMRRHSAKRAKLMKSKKIKVNYLARVEGEGGLDIKIKGDKLVYAKLNIFEPPRFFEAFLRGRNFREAPDITARICGICPVAYQMSSAHAMESICGVKVEGQLRELRRLLYAAEWIESHVLHIYMLHAPDFLGYEDAIQMAKDHPDTVKQGLRLKKVGNDIMRILGGREIHPINVRVGGFYRAPSKAELQVMVDELKWAVDAAADTAKFVAGFEFPELEHDYEFVSICHKDEYPLNEGRIVSNKGIDIPIGEFYNVFEEEHVEHSTSLHSIVKERGAYLVGPLARYSLNFDKFSPMTQQVAKECGLSSVCNSPFKSIIVRSIETLFACEECLRIIENYEKPEKPYVDVEPVAGIGHGCTEAPRGMLYHRYEIDQNGIIKDARIAPPTAQNQKTVESDLAKFIPKNLDLPHDILTWQCEQAVRNYDPCISCSCHFLKLRVERE